MTEHSRRNVLRGAAAIAAAGGLVGVTGGLAAGAPAIAKGRHFPFLEGAFAPVTEELTAFGLPVTGRIPRELNGRYLRNGPNVLGLEDPRAHHWMLGDGMVHGVRLRDGRAEWYRNRWVRSSRVAEKLGEPYPGPVPQDDFPCNTHVIGHRGRVLALQESGPLPYELDYELNTVGTYDFRGTLEGAFTAHTKLDAESGELHAMTYYPTWNHIRHLVVNAAGRVVRTTRIPVSDSPMIHDFALTEKYVVIFDMPVTFDPAGAERGDLVPYVWNERHPSRVGIMPRAGGRVRWFEVEPTYYSHTLNAYDEGSSVVVDFTAYPAPFLVAGRGSGGPYGAGTVRLHRWTIDRDRGRVRTKVLDDRPQEFPRVNEALVARRHRYGYTTAAAEMSLAYVTADGNPPDRAFSSELVKQDLLRGTSQVHRLPRNAAVGEAVFVASDPTDARAAEDDGYTLAYVHNPDRGAADLLILSAQDFTGEPVARVHLPGRVPLGFHGSWVPDA
ncbi:carotenoid cleavage dioxygenase-like enzyme [Streptomyces phaeochromogenes]|uniref:carotenoid oxygenase family protein n=1 Tax=Streptomyces phaeochromogenes TaxID=1923 RepID=UPI0027927A26|nr:carotenoid oxygenase family protein [Streptomyces phaeochromogenes]MDQ0954903.1 carotenoid cleavage dioxygenase-like enzyme [Streptomyces phaeochromogenes]